MACVQQPLMEGCRRSSRGLHWRLPGFAADDVSAYRNVCFRNGTYYFLSYRGGQLVVEYATVCFRSQEDCGPTSVPAAKITPILLPVLKARAERAREIATKAVVHP